MRNQLARAITDLREGRNLSRYALAKHLGLTTQAVVNLESGRISSPSWDTVQALADFFSVPLDTFRTRQSS